MSYVSHRRGFLNSLGLIASSWAAGPKLLGAFAEGELPTPSAPEEPEGAGPRGAIGIQVPKEATPLEKLAAQEAVRYLYLRTGKLPAIDFSDSPPKQDVVMIATKNWAGLAAAAPIRQAVSPLQAQQYLIKSEAAPGGKRIWIVGGDEVGTLYGTYRFLEKFGIRFYLHQDVIPEEKVALSLPEVEETGRPVFELRGLNPWGSHAEGIDLWNADEYKAVISQMVKMRMNIMLIHSYPPYAPYLRGAIPIAEPGVWVGLPQDVDEEGHVHFSPTASYWSTARAYIWGYLPKKTGDYRFGGSRLFESDEWGSEVLNGQFPYATTAEGRNEVFNRTGEMFREAFTFARALGMKTGLGTEACVPLPWEVLEKQKPGESLHVRQFGPPIMISEEIQQHLKELGKNPEDPAVIEELYEGVLKRIMKTHPLDYYMIFTQERWFWEGYDEQLFDLLVEEWKLALKAWEKLKPPFGLAACGWVLGPDFDHAALDKVLPKHVALSTQERAYNGPVDEAYGRIEGRQKWAMPWLEEDSSNAIRELWAGRLRQAAADALAYGCTGLIPVIWQTLANEAPVAAVAAAGWDQGGWNPEFGQEHPRPPASTLYVEGPVSRQADVILLGWTPDATPVGSIPEPQVILGTRDVPVYRTYWQGLSGYRLRVPKGSYAVTLKFIEPLYQAAGERVFAVRLQGKTVQASLDIFARAGRFQASDWRFEGIEVGGDGWLRIDFEAQRAEPVLCGIEVRGEGYRRRVKCGGGDYQAYQGDKQSWSPSAKLLWGKYAASGKGPVFEPRGLPVDDLYADWAKANFGAEVGSEAGALFAGLDTNFPLISTWTGVNGGGAGGFMPDARPWEYVRQEFEFVDQFARLRPRVRGRANLERFDSWRNHFLSTRATAHAKCIWGRLENALKQARQEEGARLRQKFAGEVVLPVYAELVAKIGEAYRLHLVTIADLGGMEKVLNWEGHNDLMGIGKMGEEIAEMLGQALPAAAVAPAEYQGEARLIVPTVRTLLAAGEALKLKVIVLDNQPAKSAALYWRPLGRGEFRQEAVRHVGRGVYTVTLRPVPGAIEYYVGAETAGGKKLVWPVTAPEINQTVVAWAAPGSG